MEAAEAAAAWRTRIDESASHIVRETGETVEEYARRLVYNKYPWIIDPRKSRRIGYWDTLTSVGLPRALGAAVGHAPPPS